MFIFVQPIFIYIHACLDIVDYLPDIAYRKVQGPADTIFHWRVYAFSS